MQNYEFHMVDKTQRSQRFITRFTDCIKNSCGIVGIQNIQHTFHISAQPFIMKKIFLHFCFQTPVVVFIFEFFEGRES